MSQCGVCYTAVLGWVSVCFSDGKPTEYARLGMRRCTREGVTFTDPSTGFVHCQCAEHWGTACVTVPERPVSSCAKSES